MSEADALNFCPISFKASASVSNSLCVKCASLPFTLFPFSL